MKREESWKVTGRSTRSSASVTVENPEPIESHPPTVDDLTLGEEAITLDAVLSNFPGRRSQVLDLIRLMGPLDCPTLPIMIYGGASTGKTSVVLEVLRHLSRPFVYSSCRTCYNPRILFESILNQLCCSNGYTASAKGCDKPSDFVNLFRESLSNVIETLESASGISRSNKPMGKMVYLILDNVDLIREWDKGSTILQFLFSLYSVLKMPQLGIILISGLPPDLYNSEMGFTDPIPLYFPQYSEDDLRQIFLRNQANRNLYSAFLDVVLRPFCRVTRRVEELSTIFSSLFRKYCEPLDDLGISPNEEMKRRLYSHLKPLIAPSLNEIFRGDTRQKASYSSENREILDFHMSTSAKYLLIAAFLASRSPATLDASMFDSTGGMDNRKRERKASEKSMENKEMAEQEAVMKGPGSFPLERLLAIFQCIASVGEEDEEEDGTETGYDRESNNIMSDILLQVSSLCDANFLIKSGSFPLEGSIRYRSMVSEDLALKVARSLGFPLSKYLYTR